METAPGAFELIADTSRPDQSENQLSGVAKMDQAIEDVAMGTH